MFSEMASVSRQKSGEPSSALDFRLLQLAFQHNIAACLQLSVLRHHELAFALSLRRFALPQRPLWDRQVSVLSGFSSLPAVYQSSDVGGPV